MATYIDLASMSEDDRIKYIGNALMKLSLVKEQAIITDNETGKAERYKRKLLANFPALEVTKIMPGPTKEAVSIFVRKKQCNPESN